EQEGCHAPDGSAQPTRKQRGTSADGAAGTCRTPHERWRQGQVATEGRRSPSPLAAVDGVCDWFALRAEVGGEFGPVAHGEGADRFERVRHAEFFPIGGEPLRRDAEETGPEFFVDGGQ